MRSTIQHIQMESIMNPLTLRNLSSDSQSECIFTSLAQCEATASGGLGECDRKAVWPGEGSPVEFFRSHAALRDGPK